ncbi:MAG: aldehyde dehydrogenase family protein [Haliea sp.]|uniref:aldehyde dehydrogenase family protein n=1 Tax=Marinobacter salarius TaxID=1420917 RepID=UPI0032EF675A
MTIDFNANYQLLIGGDLTMAENTFEAYNPATEEVIAQVPDAAKAQLDAAVVSAKAAFPGWRDTPLKERQAVVAKIGEAITEHAEAFMALLTKEQGKGRGGAEWEIGGSAYWCTEIAKQSLEPQIIENGDGHTVEYSRVPIGVVGGIVPWNFPLLLAVWKIAPALVAGNTIVIKPSPYTPLCTLKLGEVLKDIVPAGVLNIVSGGDELGKWMTEHPDIGKISFTGSTETGKKIMASAAGTLKRITLELGGNDPAIVLPDVNPKTIAEELFWTCFQNSAQFCVVAKRLYVHEAIYDEVRDALVDYAKSVTLGDGSQADTQLGPIQNRMQYGKVKELLEDIKQTGGKVVLGGLTDDQPGFFVPVTIVDNPPEESRVVKEEAFGPVLPMLKYNDIDDMIKRVNDTHYGLAASVWGNDIEQARAIAQRIEVGTVWINEIHVFGPHIPFGGHKQSGMGVENALDGLAEYTNPQTILTRERQV